MYITVFVTFMNIVPFGIDVLGMGMKMGVFCKGKCSLIIHEQRCSSDLRQHYFCGCIHMKRDWMENGPLMQLKNIMATVHAQRLSGEIWRR